MPAEGWLHQVAQNPGSGPVAVVALFEGCDHWSLGCPNAMAVEHRSHSFQLISCESTCELNYGMPPVCPIPLHTQGPFIASKATDGSTPSFWRAKSPSAPSMRWVTFSPKTPPWSMFECFSMGSSENQWQSGQLPGQLHGTSGLNVQCQAALRALLTAFTAWPAPLGPQWTTCSETRIVKYITLQAAATRMTCCKGPGTQQNSFSTFLSTITYFCTYTHSQSCLVLALLVRAQFITWTDQKKQMGLPHNL